MKIDFYVKIKTYFNPGIKNSQDYVIIKKLFDPSLIKSRR